MDRKLNYVYLDSSVYLAIFNNEDNVNGANRVHHSRYYLEKAAGGKIKILASTLVIVEIYKVFENSGSNNDMNNWNIWEWDFLEIANVNIDIALISVRILSDCPAKIKPPDSIHLATALHYKNLLNLPVFRFLTWDDKLIQACKDHMNMFNLRLQNPVSESLF